MAYSTAKSKMNDDKASSFRPFRIGNQSVTTRSVKTIIDVLPVSVCFHTACSCFVCAYLFSEMLLIDPLHMSDEIDVISDRFRNPPQSSLAIVVPQSVPQSSVCLSVYAC